MKEDRSPRTRLRDAAHQPRLPDGPLSLRRSGVPDHHLPDRPGEAARAWCPSRSRSTSRVVKFEFIRMPNSTGLRRLHRERPGHPGILRGPPGRLHALHVPGRPSAHRRRPRALGLSQEAGQARAAGRDRHPGRHPGLRPGPDRHRDHGLQASRGAIWPRSRRRWSTPTWLLEDHPACRWHAADLRTGRVLPRGRRS